MSLNETTYGIKKRLEFLVEIISKAQPSAVLDVGCGTGAYLTQPLAERFGSINFLGIDSDRVSIEFARNSCVLPNLTYSDQLETPAEGKFDLIICSEVIEHVEDPTKFLSSLTKNLSEDGKMVLTVPNGYGPFELVSWIESVLYLSGVYATLRTIKNMLLRRPKAHASVSRDTLAVSPHINFFSHRDLLQLFGSEGLRVREYRPRTFLCGFGFDQLFRSAKMIHRNAQFAEVLPRSLSSGWMFLLERGEITGHSAYKRNLYAKLRKYLNERRWGIR